ncbi:MAG: hypothetical protein CVV64_03150 [Candidatus Wallbacteria bacterium HGW-Wallbacteria-1]|jgi:polyhydroxyalkanoate synthesis regulator phasin|uniref:Polyhydroxyalkanoate synthesis regulator n=1 Tax=Candidatus Wallbacteria bacterium HGW-Wallbacteria-1 TaxID=2013854 RepID=A0A2N1PTL0_9BACT|nr:MAG: hypothetical protein CVV64_03150 [Candidatus Wallbacteria bacterium HGW-Wallbacteria-1]
MFDAMEKFLYAGLGVFSITRKRAEEIAENLVENGKVQAEEGLKFADCLFQKAEAERKVLVKFVEDEVARVLSKMGVVTTRDYEELQKRVERLETYINEMASSATEAKKTRKTK